MPTTRFPDIFRIGSHTEPFSGKIRAAAVANGKFGRLLGISDPPLEGDLVRKKVCAKQIWFTVLPITQLSFLLPFKTQDLCGKYK